MTYCDFDKKFVKQNTTNTALGYTLIKVDI